VPRTWWRPSSGDEARITVGVALSLLALLLIVRWVPSDPHALSLDDVGKTIHLDIARVIPPVVPELRQPKADRGRDAGGGGPKVASAGPTGAAGDQKAPRRDSRRATKGPATNQDARDVERIVHEGTLLSILDGPHSAAVDHVFDRTPALGDALNEVFGHMVGTTIADAYGVHGLGPIGTGRGAADEGKGIIGGDGTGRRIGPGHGGPGYGPGAYTAGTLGPRTMHTLPDVKTTLNVHGNLDKEIIRRVVRTHLNEVRFCYDEALARKPSLAGRVVAQFTIAPTGKVLVSALQSSTLGEAKVESCILAATRRWLYPAPYGGGLVTVTYPFQLAPVGG
jgi:hypothetical protein